jgi:predicted adenylyl cyclase CyaB
LRNIELKARLDNWDRAREIAQQIATAYPGVERQVDTYFNCPQGRLKLREIEGRMAQLIWYSRADQSNPKPSDYYLAPVADPKKIKAILSSAFGVKAVVDKRREIFLAENVRIHLDEVAGLGRFIEFEAVLGPDADEASGYAALKGLKEQFSIPDSALLSGSYGEMFLGIED